MSKGNTIEVLENAGIYEVLDAINECKSKLWETRKGNADRKVRGLLNRIYDQINEVLDDLDEE